MIDNSLVIERKIQELENELYRILERGYDPYDRKSDIIDELNWYNEQYAERY